MKIEVGKNVRVHMTRNDIFNFQAGPSFYAILVGLPQGAGDTYKFEVMGHRIHVNGNSSDFIAIELEP